MPRKTKETGGKKSTKLADVIKEVLNISKISKQKDADKSVSVKKAPKTKSTKKKTAETKTSKTKKDKLQLSEKKDFQTSSAKKADTSSKKSTTTKSTTAKKTVSAKKAKEDKPVTAKKTTTVKKSTVSKKAQDTKTDTSKKASTKKTTVVKKTTTAKSTPAKKTITAKKDTAKKSTVAKKPTTASKTKATSVKKAAPAKAKTKTKTSKKEIKSTAAKKSTSTKISTSKKSSIINENKFSAEYYDLPFRYNQTVVKILAQTPKNLFIYWEISDEDRLALKKQYGEYFFEITKPVLIVYNETLNYSFEVEIDDFANSWYLHVDDSNSEYKVELGRRPIPVNYSYMPDYDIEKNGPIEELKIPYFYISSSNELDAPNDRILFNKISKVYFRNVKTNELIAKDISDFPNIYKDGIFINIYKLYQELYKEEIKNDSFNLLNPSSGNVGSGSFSSRFF